MIVISGALVVVALVLLVIGLVIAGLGWVYGSIAVSLLSFVFLVIGILQRRKEAPPVAETPALATTLARSTGSSVEPSTESVAVRTAPATAAAADDDEATVTTLPTAQGPAGKVLVVAGRPRYHVEGCRYLTGKDAESVDMSEARAEGFTACGVCKPDAALAAGADGAEATAAFEAPVSADVPDGVVEAPVVDEPARKAPARARTTAAPAKAAVKKAAPAKKAAAPAKKAAAPVKKAAAPAKKAAAPAKAAVKKAAPAKAAPAKSAAAKAPAKKAPAKKAPAKRA